MKIIIFSPNSHDSQNEFIFALCVIFFSGAWQSAGKSLFSEEQNQKQQSVRVSFSHRCHSGVPHRPGEDAHAEPALHGLLRRRADVQEQLRLCEESAALRGRLWILQR